MSSPMHGRKAVHFASLRAKLAQQGKASLALRLLLAAALAGFLLVFAARTLLLSSSSSSSSRVQHQATVDTPSADCATTTNNNNAAAAAAGGVPHAVMEALVHYTTSNITPQQTAAEIGVSLRVLQRRAPCNFLVFGLGHDSPMWSALNHGGRTVFLEEDASWIATVRSSHPSLESYHVGYDTVLTDAESLLQLRHDPSCVAETLPDLAAAADAGCRLATSLKDLPPVFYETEWDLVMVDAPTGWTPTAPGRMGAIYAAGMVARARRAGDGDTDVFVHDVDRPVEDAFSKAFLCEGYLAEQVGRIRHFVIPSHRQKDGMPFCP